jgi:hypothetical protein
MNNDAELYSSYDHGQKVDVNYFLSTYWNLLKWKNNENVLYVGAATGDVTTEILLPRLPTNLKKIVGVDILENVVSCEPQVQTRFQSRFRSFGHWM